MTAIMAAGAVFFVLWVTFQLGKERGREQTDVMRIAQQSFWAGWEARGEELIPNIEAQRQAGREGRQ